MTRLSDRLNEARDANDINVDAAVLKAQEAGFKIDRSIVYKALKGNHAKNPSDNTLRALGAVFNLDPTELRRLLDLPAGELEPYVPPAYANRLNRDQRKALNDLIRTIVESRVEPERRLSVASDTTDLLRAADEQETPISAEQEGEQRP